MFKFCSKIKGNLFKSQTQNTAKSAITDAPECEFCDAVRRFGRSGERTVKFESGKECIVEIINESKVEGRKCYSLNVSNGVGVWTELPITHCPFCGKRLGAK